MIREGNLIAALIVFLLSLHLHSTLGHLINENLSNAQKYNLIFNHIIHHGQLTPTISTPPTYHHPLVLQTATFNPYNFGISTAAFGDPDDEFTYLASDGRILKQYLVRERHDEDNSLDSYANNPFNGNPFRPFIPTNVNSDPNTRPNYNFPTSINRNAEDEISPRVSNNAGGAISLGSGSLGFIRSANGEVYLGSGSLGYINNQQRSDVARVISERYRQSSEPGPLSFGHSPR